MGVVKSIYFFWMSGIVLTLQGPQLKTIMMFTNNVELNELA